jgi:hypothetical protein
MQIDELRVALKRHRLSQGLSYEELAADMLATVGPKRAVSMFTLRNFIEGVHKPYETTEYAIADYLRAQGVAA